MASRAIRWAKDNRGLKKGRLAEGAGAPCFYPPQNTSCASALLPVTRRYAITPANMDQPDGLVAVYQNIRPRLLRLLIARTGNQAVAEDLLQDLWIKLQTLDVGPVGNPEAYLSRMAYNLANDQTRFEAHRQRREHHWIEAETTFDKGIALDEAPDSERTLIARQELALLRQALTELPPRAAEIFRRHRVEGQSHAEIAAELGISRSAVEKSMAVALKHLFRLLSG